MIGSFCRVEAVALWREFREVHPLQGRKNYEKLIVFRFN